MHTVHSVHENPANGLVVSIQTHMSNGLPAIQLIGVVGKSLDEARDRIRSAFASSNISLPRKKITINIAPSDIPKNGAHYDLALAVSILMESNQIKSIDENIVYLGELGLDGEVKPVRGILGKILTAKENGIRQFVIPQSNVEQASLIPNIQIHPAKSLKELINSLQNNDLSFINTRDGAPISSDGTDVGIDFSEVVGQNIAKRALEIAAAGQHNILLSGPPGVGKSMLAKALISIMPPLTRDEVITITHLHSLVGNGSGKLVTSRPLRSPHHSASDVAIIGGGQNPRPGEITLSHTGVLFLDELPEFKRSTIESLRQPLEDKQVTVSRAKETNTYPADFLLVATKNPCPCGFYGSSKPCVCTPLEIDRYQKKLSGPLLDRIDLHVTVDSVDHTKLLKNTAVGSQSNQIRANIIKAVDLQNKRYSKNAKRNGIMSNSDIKSHSHIENSAKELLDDAAEKLQISARVYMKIVKVARTIADLENSKTITKQHVSEAIRYRPAITS